jgi:hypothetical protein
MLFLIYQYEKCDVVPVSKNLFYSDFYSFTISLLPSVGYTTLSIMTFRITTLSIMTFRITTLGIMTFSITIKNASLRIMAFDTAKMSVI